MEKAWRNYLTEVLGVKNLWVKEIENPTAKNSDEDHFEIPLTWQISQESFSESLDALSGEFLFLNWRQSMDEKSLFEPSLFEMVLRMQKALGLEDSQVAITDVVSPSSREIHHQLLQQKFKAVALFRNPPHEKSLQKISHFSFVELPSLATLEAEPATKKQAWLGLQELKSKALDE